MVAEEALRWLQEPRAVWKEGATKRCGLNSHALGIRSRGGQILHVVLSSGSVGYISGGLVVKGNARIGAIEEGDLADGLALGIPPPSVSCLLRCPAFKRSQVAIVRGDPLGVDAVLLKRRRILVGSLVIEAVICVEID